MTLRCSGNSGTGPAISTNASVQIETLPMAELRGVNQWQNFEALSPLVSAYARHTQINWQQR